MPSRTLPGLGLDGFWPYEEDNWNTGMDQNLLKLSVYARQSVLDQDLTVAPGSPTNGDIYIVGQGATGTWAGQDGKLAVRDNGAWVYLDALNGLIMLVEDEDIPYQYNGGWFPLVRPYAFSAYCNYRQVFSAAATWQLVPTNNGRHNDQGVWAAGTGLFTAAVDGYYHFTGMWTYDDETTDPGFIAAGLSVNGADPTDDVEDRYTAGMVGGETSVNVQGVLKLSAGDTVGLMGYISSGDGAMVANRNRFAGFKIA